MRKIITFAFLLFLSSMAYADVPHPWQINFQEAASPIMYELHHFHNFLLIICTVIVCFVAVLIGYVILRFNAKSNPVPAKFSHNITIEVIWTVIPIIVLVIIAIPSFRILRLTEHIPQAEMTVKVLGSQWYWTYTYPDYNNYTFDSNIIQDKDLKPGQHRLLEVDNRLLIPQGTVVKFLITGADVIHSFGVPSLALKTDAIPGKVNEAWTRIDNKGVYYGQCSELCGIKHGFMPIAIEVVSKDEFKQWIEAKTKPEGGVELKEVLAK